MSLMATDNFLHIQDKGKRLATLDAFRFFAITIVIFFHYLTRWTVPITNRQYYPYGNHFADIPIFANGSTGVEFFFMISGFVILFTLEHTKNFREFLIRRFIRLWPTMLLCTVITFSITRLMDPMHLFENFEVRWLSFLPSLTFTEWFWDVQFMDSVYWSLEVEVKFYLISAIIFYLLKDHFVLAWIIFVLGVLILDMLFPVLNHSKQFHYFFFPSYLPFFSLGILFYELYKGNKKEWIWLATVIFLVFGIKTRMDMADRILIGIFYIFFILFIYKNQWLQWINKPWILAIGVASYPLYLLHQNIGIILINKLHGVFSLNGNWQLIYPISTYIIFCILSYFLYLYYELPVKRVLMKMLKRKKQPLPQTVLQNRPEVNLK